MSRSNQKKDCVALGDARPSIVPAGLPDWITTDLIEETIRVWQPYYPTILTAEDAIGMIRSVGGLFQALKSHNNGGKG
jgi:hypothetical protein